jgi:hypothetical protein
MTGRWAPHFPRPAPADTKRCRPLSAPDCSGPRASTLPQQSPRPLLQEGHPAAPTNFAALGNRASEHPGHDGENAGIPRKPAELSNTNAAVRCIAGVCPPRRAGNRLAHNHKVIDVKYETLAERSLRSGQPARTPPPRAVWLVCRRGKPEAHGAALYDRPAEGERPSPAPTGRQHSRYRRISTHIRNADIDRLIFYVITA